MNMRNILLRRENEARAVKRHTDTGYHFRVYMDINCRVAEIKYFAE